MGAVFLQIVQLSLIFYNGLLLLLLCGLSFNRIEMQGEKQQTVIGLLLRCQSTVALSQIHIEKFGHMSEQNNLISKHILRNICCNCKKWSKENVFFTRIFMGGKSFCFSASLFATSFPKSTEKIHFGLKVMFHRLHFVISHLTT